MIECTKWTEVNKGALWGFADIYIAKSDQDVYGCSVFRSNGKTWMNWPSRDYEDKEGKKKFWPHVKYRNAKTDEAFKAAALAVILKKAEESKVFTDQQYELPLDDELPF